MTNFKLVYERFINIAIAAENLSEAHLLDPIERRVLYILSTYWSNGKTITVGESIKRIDELSSATVFKYIKQLKNKGYLQLVVDEKSCARFHAVVALVSNLKREKAGAKQGKLTLGLMQIDINQ